MHQMKLRPSLPTGDVAVAREQHNTFVHSHIALDTTSSGVSSMYSGHPGPSGRTPVVEWSAPTPRHRNNEKPSGSALTWKFTLIPD